VSLAGLAMVNGVGETKLAKYGQQILEVLGEDRELQPGAGRCSPATRTPPPWPAGAVAGSRTHASAQPDSMLRSRAQLPSG
jgi:ATP-dependent DNA helicase RecQ